MIRNIKISKDTFLDQMVQKSSYQNVQGVFFKSPKNIHFIKSISREINLSPTSVRGIIEILLKEKMIKKKKSKPFDGFVANRDNDMFIYAKRCFNFLSLFELRNYLIDELSPKAIILFGSYSRGDDVEESDIDLVVISKVFVDFDFSNFENSLERNINCMCVKFLDELDEMMRCKVLSGTCLYGEI